MIPANHAEWRRCIEVDCAIPLTPTFVAQRLQVLTDTASSETQRFARLYGDAHLQRVIGWFQSALPTAR